MASKQSDALADPYVKWGQETASNAGYESIAAIAAFIRRNLKLEGAAE